MADLATGTGEPSRVPERALLSVLDRWRSLLARNALLQHPLIRSGELDAFVHGLIIRVLYLRICEEQGLIPAGTIGDITPAAGLQERITSLFRDAEPTSPLSLFACTRGEEQGTPAPETVLDDQALRGFLEALDPASLPCDFRAFPPARLSGVFRLLLRKEIRVQGGHRVVLEETAGARGAGGYPAPPEAAREYLVIQALANTAGWEAGDAGRFRVLDPACGPGHLLLLSHRHLMNQRLNPRPDGGDPSWSNDWEGRFRILGSLHGVDPDTRAVEVTRMLLLLSALGQGDTWETPQVSPDLTEHCRRLRGQIRCGNAVIGPDYLEETFPRPTPRRIRELGISMDRAAAVPSGMDSGGFDVVVTEPPTYHPGTNPGLRSYLQQHFQAYHDDADMSIYVMERGLSLVSRGGTFASLTPDRWLRARHAGPLRKFLSTLPIREIVIVTPGGRITGQGTGHSILRVNPYPAGGKIRMLRVDPRAFTSQSLSRLQGILVDPGSLGEGGWTFTDRDVRELKGRLERISSPLGRFVAGSLASWDPAIPETGSLVDRVTRDRMIREEGRDPAEFRPVAAGDQVQRFAPFVPVWYLPAKGRATDIPGFSAGTTGVILCTEHRGIPVCTLDTTGALAGNRVICIPRQDLYLLGVLNSTLSRFLFREGGGKLTVRWLEQFPVYVPDFTVLDDTARHDRLEALVSRMLELHARMRMTVSGEGRNALSRQMWSTDREIDELVYGLYGFSEEEKRIVEETLG